MTAAVNAGASDHFIQKQMRVASGAIVRRYASVNEANLCSVSEAVLDFVIDLFIHGFKIKLMFYNYVSLFIVFIFGYFTHAFIFNWHTIFVIQSLKIYMFRSLQFLRLRLLSVTR